MNKPTSTTTKVAPAAQISGAGTKIADEWSAPITALETTDSPVVIAAKMLSAADQLHARSHPKVESTTGVRPNHAVPTFIGVPQSTCGTSVAASLGTADRSISVKTATHTK